MMGAKPVDSIESVPTCQPPPISKLPMNLAELFSMVDHFCSIYSLAPTTVYVYRSPAFTHFKSVWKRDPSTKKILQKNRHNGSAVCFIHRCQIIRLRFQVNKRLQVLPYLAGSSEMTLQQAVRGLRDYLSCQKQDQRRPLKGINCETESTHILGRLLEPRLELRIHRTEITCSTTGGCQIPCCPVSYSEDKINA